MDVSIIHSTGKSMTTASTVSSATSSTGAAPAAEAARGAVIPGGTRGHGLVDGDGHQPSLSLFR